NITFNDSDKTFQSCVLSPLGMQSPDTVLVYPDCGNSSLREFINTGKIIFSNIVIHPNPVSIGTQLGISFDLNQQSDVSIILRDALGRSAAEISQPALRKGSQSFTLDLPKQGSGFYILSIEAAGERIS